MIQPWPLARSVLRRLHAAPFEISRRLHRLSLVGQYAGCQISPRARLGRSVRIVVADAGKLTIGANVSIGDQAQIIVKRGELKIGDDTFIGPGVVITARDSIEIGRHCLIGEYVVIRDQDHHVDSGDPIRTAGFTTAPIRVEDNVWLGAKATVLRGSHIGCGAVVGAHSLVKGRVECNTIAVGIPARALRKREPITDDASDLSCRRL